MIETKPILLVFASKWCHHCKTQAIIIDEIKKEFDDKIIIKIVNADTSEKKSAKYNIKGVPSLVIEVNKVVVAQFLGLTQANILRTTLGKLV